MAVNIFTYIVFEEGITFVPHCLLTIVYFTKKGELAMMFSHTNISFGQCETFVCTIIEILVVIMFSSIMNCRINWSRSKREGYCSCLIAHIAHFWAI